MGWDPETQQLQELSADEAKNWTKGPVFHEGEEVVLKGLTFTIVDIAPGQIKLKPKRTHDAKQQLEAAKEKLEAELAKVSQR
jgi:hypothetical protein